MAKLVVNRPGKPEGAEVHVVGLGVFKNGQEYELEGLPEDLVVGVPLGDAKLPPRIQAFTVVDPPVGQQDTGASDATSGAEGGGE